MTAENWLALAKPFKGKRGRDLKEKGKFALRFWMEQDRENFLATVPASDILDKGPCDDLEYYWVWVRTTKT